MPNFSRRLETHQGHLNFYFNRIDAEEGRRYHVSVVDRSNKTQIFYLVENRRRWKVVQPENLPNWIVSMEAQFQKEILQHQKCDKITVGR